MALPRNKAFTDPIAKVCIADMSVYLAANLAGKDSVDHGGLGELRGWPGAAHVEVALMHGI